MDPVDAVDAALAVASRGESLTGQEALRLLGAVQVAIRAGRPDPSIDQIITAATTSCAGRAVIDRILLVNPLLDVRLALCVAAAS